MQNCWLKTCPSEPGHQSATLISLRFASIPSPSSITDTHYIPLEGPRQPMHLRLPSALSHPKPLATVTSRRQQVHWIR